MKTTKYFKFNILAIVYLMLFSSTIEAQYYNRENYGTNKSVSVYSAKYTEHTTSFEKLIQIKNLSYWKRFQYLPNAR